MRFIKDTRGATAIEYGLIAAGIALALSGTLYLFGDDIADLFNRLSGLIT